MKYLIFWKFIFNLFLLSSVFLQAQEQQYPNSKNEKPLNQIKTNLFGHLVGQYQLSYERFLLKNRFSLQCSAAFFKQTVVRMGSNDIGQIGYKSEAVGWSVQPEIRYYFSSKKRFLKNCYAATSFRYRKGKTKITDLSQPSNINMSADAHNITQSSALVFGYRSIIKKYVCLETFIGTQYRVRKSKKTFESNEVSELQFDNKFAHIESQTLDITGANWDNGAKFLPYLGLNIGILF
ncbi:MAG: DUF3575 domain-containing protein [Chitinophagales bacterium]